MSTYITEARPFNQVDWDGLAGCERFTNGDDPVIRHIEIDDEAWMLVADAQGVGFFYYGADDSEAEGFLDLRFPTQAAAKAFLNGIPAGFDHREFGVKLESA